MGAQMADLALAALGTEELLTPDTIKARTAVLTAWQEGTLPKGVSFTGLVDRLILAVLQSERTSDVK